MRAIQIREFGGPEVLVPAELPEPVAGPGQAVVGLAAADVIYLDTLLRSGWGGEFFPTRTPYVPGHGGAGRVLSVGEGVDPGWVGRHVVAWASGGYAERLVAAVEELVEVPDGLGSAEAAAVMHDGTTALRLLAEAQLSTGEWVLIAAAAGGAGSLLVQLARDAGARVVAAARGERKLALVRELGAEVAVDYSVDGWQHRVREATGGAGVDLAFDGAGGALGKAVFEAVAHRGVRAGRAGADPPGHRRDLSAGAGQGRTHRARTARHGRQVAAAHLAPGGVTPGRGSAQRSQGAEYSPSWCRMATRSSRAQISVIRPSAIR